MNGNREWDKRMRVALAVNRVTADIHRNLDEILGMINEAAFTDSDLTLFPEAAVTGLINFLLGKTGLLTASFSQNN